MDRTTSTLLAPGVVLTDEWRLVLVDPCDGSNIYRGGWVRRYAADCGDEELRIAVVFTAVSSCAQPAFPGRLSQMYVDTYTRMYFPCFGNGLLGCDC